MQRNERQARFASPSLDASLAFSSEKKTASPTKIKFWLSDCEFAYGDFRDEESAAHKFEGFLVVGSKKGDTLSLFEMKS